MRHTLFAAVAAVSLLVAGAASAQMAHYTAKLAGAAGVKGSGDVMAMLDGKTLTYTATESALTGIGKRARMLNVQSSAGRADDRWSLVYQGKGFIGVVTVVGPNASQAAARELGQQAYTYAAKSLS